MSTLLPGFNQYTKQDIIKALDTAIADTNKRNRLEEVCNLEKIRSDVMDASEYSYLMHPDTDEVYRISKAPSTLYALHGETERRYVLELTNVCIACITLIGLGQKKDVLHVSVPDTVGAWRVINSSIDIQSVQPDGNFYVTEGIRKSLPDDAIFVKCPDSDKYFLV